MLDVLRERFRSLSSSADFWSLRYVEEQSEALCIRQNIVLPPQLSFDRGAMVTAHADGGYGYAATSDLSPAGLQAALDRATAWARATAPHALVDSRTIAMPAPRGEHVSPELRPLPSRRIHSYNGRSQSKREES